MQEIAASRSRTLGLISAFKTVLPNFSMRILVGLEMLSANRENHVVDNLSILKNLPAFWKLMVRIEMILCTKVVRRIAIDEFQHFGLFS